MKCFLLLLLISPLLCFSQISPKLVCTDINVSGDDFSYDTSDVRFVGFLEGEGKNSVKFFSNDELSINAFFYLRTINSKRSSVKSGSVRIEIVYYLVAGNSIDKRITERIVYLGDNVDFSFVENFVYEDGLKNKRVSLTYKLTKQ